MKKLLRIALLIGIVTAVINYLNGDTAAGAWHDAPDTSSGL